MLEEVDLNSSNAGDSDKYDDLGRRAGMKVRRQGGKRGVTVGESGRASETQPEHESPTP